MMRFAGSDSWQRGRTPGSPPGTLNLSPRRSGPSPRQRGLRLETRPDQLRRDSVTRPEGGHCDARFKRLEKGSFRFPAVATEGATKGVEVKAADLMMILDGVDLGSVRRQRRYERQP